MVMIVVICNLLIALLCWVGVWQLLQVQRSLAAATAILTEAERSTHSVLSNAPQGIAHGQIGLYELRLAYQQSGLRWQRVQRALLLLGLGRSLWRPRLQPIGFRRLRR